MAFRCKPTPARPAGGEALQATAEVFPFIHVEGVELGVARLRPPWVIRREGLSGGGLYAVREGECWFEMEEGPARRLRLRRGDVVAVAKRRSHSLRDSLATPLSGRSTALALQPVSAGEHPLPGGDGGAELLVFWSAGGHPLEEVFPPVAYVPADGSRPSEGIRRALALAEFELAGGKRPGSDAILRRLAEIVVIELLRAVMTRVSGPNPAWLSALGDPSVMRVVAAMHERPSEGWTLRSLAGIAGLSRSAFVARFRSTIGEPPMQHLMRTRMQRAAIALLEGHRALPEIASAVGYDSESAFHRAFRRAFGVTPGGWRTMQRAARSHDPLWRFPLLGAARELPPGIDCRAESR